MTIRPLSAMALFMVLGILLSALPAAARDLTVVSRSTALLMAQREAYLSPFVQATGLPIHEQLWEGGLDVLRSEAPLWDIVLVDGGELLSACAGGLLMKLDWGTIGGRDHYLSQATNDCGVGALASEIVLAWDRDKFQGTPTWADFWDVAKYPGKRALQQGARMNLEIALMADGVAPGDVYRTLRTDDGVERAFRKLDQIKPYLVWWKTADDAPKLLGSGDVLLTTAPSERIAAANPPPGHHFGMQVSGGLYEILSWGIVKGSPNLASAEKLLALMGDPAREARFTSLTGFGTLAKGATGALTPEQLALAPGNPANLSASLQIDEQFWNDNLQKLNRRFDAWLSQDPGHPANP